MPELQNVQCLNRIEAAHYCSLRGFKTSPATLATLASRGGGPRYIYFGKRPLYTQADLDDWITSRSSAKVKNTSERYAVSDRDTLTQTARADHFEAATPRKRQAGRWA